MDKYYLNAKKTALLLIDIQEKMLPAIYQKETLLKPTKTLITTAEVFELPILVTEQYPQGLGTTIPELKVKLDQVKANFWEKTSFSACLPEIMGQIRTNEIDTILLAGIESHVCVFQTTRDLLQDNFNVHIVADAVGSRDPENKKIALNLMAEMGAVITNSETVAFDLLKDAKAEQFKVISNALK